MLDIFDIMAFVVFAVLIATAVVIVVGLGMLPGWIALNRGHPQAAAINVASWLGVATLGLLWPLALIWAFTQSSARIRPDLRVDSEDVQSRVAALEARLRELDAGKEADA